MTIFTVALTNNVGLVLNEFEIKPVANASNPPADCGSPPINNSMCTYDWMTVIYWSEIFAVNKSYFLLGSEWAVPETRIWFHISSITGYSMWDGQLLLVSKRSSPLLSHLIHLLSRSMGQLLKWPSEQRFSQRRFNRRCRALGPRLCLDSGITWPQLSCSFSGRTFISCVCFPLNGVNFSGSGSCKNLVQQVV